MNHDFSSLVVSWWYRQLKDSACTKPQVTRVLIESRQKRDFDQRTNDLVAATLWQNPMLGWERVDQIVHIATGL